MTDWTNSAADRATELVGEYEDSPTVPEDVQEAVRLFTFITLKAIPQALERKDLPALAGIVYTQLATMYNMGRKYGEGDERA